MVYKFRSSSHKHRIFNDHKIEIQIRSKLQHAWATAVEIVDAFTGQALKSGLKLNLGDPDWRRFFVLMGTAIALREKRQPVVGSPVTNEELKTELQALTKKLRVVEILSGLNVGMDLGDELKVKHPKTTAYLLLLDLGENKVHVSAYTREQLPAANDEYLKIEKENEGNPQKLVVLVAVESVKALRVAYPNYYLDSRAFIAALKQVIDS